MNMIWDIALGKLLADLIPGVIAIVIIFIVAIIKMLLIMFKNRKGE